MIKVNVFVKNLYWQKYLTDPKNYFNKQIKKLRQKEKSLHKKNYSFSIMLTGNKDIKYFNNKFRNKNKTTDILSFPFYEKKELYKKLKKDKEIYLGDIIVNLNKIERKKNIKEFKLAFNKLWLHGLVHLFGYDHKKDKDYLRMIKVEEKLLAYLN